MRKSNPKGKGANRNASSGKTTNSNQKPRARGQSRPKQITQGPAKTIVRGQADPFVNFGGVIQQFLNCGHLDAKCIELKYNHEGGIGNKYEEFNLSFRRPAENGLTMGPVETYTLQRFLENRREILQVGEVPTDKWTDFVDRLYLRTGLKISQVPSQNIVKDVTRTIREHLTPIERAIMELSESEWHQVDLKKVKRVQTKYTTHLDGHYPEGREMYINKSIAGSTNVILPLNWILIGFSFFTKQMLRNDFYVEKTLSDEQKGNLTQIHEKITAARSTAVPTISLDPGRPAETSKESGEEEKQSEASESEDKKKRSALKSAANAAGKLIGL